MKAKTIALTVAALLVLTVQSAIAADSVGYNRMVIPANSDVLLSVPFTTEAEGAFTVNSVTASGVTVTDSLEDGQYAASYYVRFISGNASGLWSTISDNDAAGNINIANMNVLGLVSNGDTFRVYKHNTLGSVFPKSMYGVSFTSGTQVFFYDNDINTPILNKSAYKVAAYTTSGGGRWVGSGVTSNTVLEPETQFILRNNTSADMEMISLGKVPDYSVSALVAAGGDFVMGSGYPVPVKLTNSGLEGNQRQVFFYDNSATGINKSASLVAAYTTSGGGRWVGAGITAEQMINPSAAITLRLPAGDLGSKVTIVKPY